jgi:hypothetical protein
MALTFSTDFQKFANVNSQELVYLVHLYTGESTYLALASYAVVIGTKQYIACVSDFGSWSETWKALDDNGTTLGSPTVTLRDYQTPDGYSIFDDFPTVGFSGKQIVLLMGYAGTALSDFIKIFDGLVEDISVKTGSIEITTHGKDLPETLIAGRALDYANQKIGTNTYGGLIIHEDADGKRLPIPFGRQWNSPLVCFDKQADEESYWCPRDNDWWAAVANADTGILSHYRENLGRAMTRLLIPQKEKLVPYAPVNFANETTYALGLDARASNLPYAKIIASASCVTTMTDGSVLIEVPLRFRYDSSLGGTPPDNPENIFDGNGDTYTRVHASYTLFTPLHFYAWLEKSRNLSHEEDCVQHRLRPIHVTQSEYGEDEWQALLFGRIIRGAGTQDEYGWYLGFACTVIGNPDRTAGSSRISRNQEITNSEYCYCSHLAMRNIGGGWNIYELTDPISPRYYDPGVADTGNYSATATEGVLPYLGREALDYPVKAYFSLFLDAGGYPNTIDVDFYDLVYSAFESADVNPSIELFAELTGLTLTAKTSIYAQPTDWGSPYVLYCPPQYIEAVLRAKIGQVDANFNSTEWGAACDFWTAFFGTSRDYSGFTLTGDINFKQWFSDYIKREPFCIYRDGLGVWRFRPVYKNLTAIEAAVTPTVIDFTEVERESFEISLTEDDKIAVEIKSMKSDKVYFDNSFVQDNNFKLDSSAYDYDFWKTGNTADDNQLFIKEVEKEYTSCAYPLGRCTVDGVGYGCQRTCKGHSPAGANGYYWDLLAGVSTVWDDVSPEPTIYNADTTYFGADSENSAIASYTLNLLANRHRQIKFSTKFAKYFGIELGDYLEFTNVPYDLLGITVKGFAGNEDTDYVALNGQNVYYAFQVTSVARKRGQITVTCIQCHDLAAYTPVLVHTVSTKQKELHISPKKPVRK